MVSGGASRSSRSRVSAAVALGPAPLEQHHPGGVRLGQGLAQPIRRQGGRPEVQPLEAGAVGGRQGGEVEHGGIAPDRDVLLAGLGLGREQELRGDEAPLRDARR